MNRVLVKSFQSENSLIELRKIIHTRMVHHVHDPSEVLLRYFTTMVKQLNGNYQVGNNRAHSFFLTRCSIPVSIRPYESMAAQRVFKCVALVAYRL